MEHDTPVREISTPEQLMNELIRVMELNNNELTFLDCLQIIMEECNLTEDDIAAMVDKNLKEIIRTNCLESGYFRKSFYQRNFTPLF